MPVTTLCALDRNESLVPESSLMRISVLKSTTAVDASGILSEKRARYLKASCALVVKDCDCVFSTASRSASTPKTV